MQAEGEEEATAAVSVALAVLAYLRHRPPPSPRPPPPVPSGEGDGDGEAEAEAEAEAEGSGGNNENGNCDGIGNDKGKGAASDGDLLAAAPDDLRLELGGRIDSLLARWSSSLSGGRGPSHGSGNGHAFLNDGESDRFSPAALVSDLERTASECLGAPSSVVAAAAASSVPPPRPHRVLASCLDQRTRSLDAFEDLLHVVLGGCTRPGTAAGGGRMEPSVDPEGAVGLHVRRTVLGYRRLGFEGAARLWTSCRRWTEGALQASDQLHGGSEAGEDLPPSAPPPRHRLHQHSPHHHQSTSDLAMHYAHHLAALQSGERVGAVESLHRYFDYAVIAGRREALGRLVGGGGAGASSHNPGNQQHQGANTQPGSSDGGNPPDHARPLSRYAPLLLCRLYHSQGHTGLALRSAEEAVRVGQQSGDGPAVTLALGWMALLAQEREDGGGTGRWEGQGDAAVAVAVAGDAGAGADADVHADADARDLWELVRSRSSAGAGPPSLSSRSSLALALARARAGPPPSSGPAATAAAAGSAASHRLAHAWADLAAATGPALAGAAAAATAAAGAGRPGGGTAGMGGASGASGGLPGGGVAGAAMSTSTASAGGGEPSPHDLPATVLPVSCRQTSDNIDHVARLQALLGGELWSGVGRDDLASLYARISLGGRGGVGEGGNLSGEELAAAVEAVARGMMRGDGAGDRSSHERSLEALLDLRRAHPEIDVDVWSTGVAFVLHDWSVRLGAPGDPVPAAARLHLTSRLGAVPSNEAAGEGASQSLSSSPYRSALSGSTEAALRLLTAEASSLSAMGRSREATDIVRAAVSLASRRGMRSHQARSLIMLARLELDRLAPPSPPLPLPPLLECLSLCERWGMDAVHAEALSVMGRAQLLGGNVGRARSAVRASLPALVQSAEGDVIAEAWLTLAKCDLAGLKSVSSGGNYSEGANKRRRWQLLLRTRSHLMEAERLSRSMSDVRLLQEVSYLRAQVSNGLAGPDQEEGQDRRQMYMSERDAAARTFVSTSERLRSRGVGSPAEAAIPTPSSFREVEQVTKMKQFLSTVAAAC